MIIVILPEGYLTIGYGNEQDKGEVDSMDVGRNNYGDLETVTVMTLIYISSDTYTVF